jgi:hypothetical protein
MKKFRFRSRLQNSWIEVMSASTYAAVNCLRQSHPNETICMVHLQVYEPGGWRWAI